MFFNLNPINFFIISGLVQNFILAGITFFRKGDQSLANRLMATTILIVNFHFTYLMLLDTELDNIFPPVLWFPYSALTAIGPIIYLYTYTLANSAHKISINLRHFIPVCIEVGLQLIMVAGSIIEDEMFYNTRFYFYFTPLIYVSTVISVGYYLRLSLQVINNHESWALKNFSNLKEITLRWLQKLIVYYRMLWLVWIPFIALFLLFFRFQLQYLMIVGALYLLMLVMTYLTYWIGFENLAHVNLLSGKLQDEKQDNKNFSKLSVTETQELINNITKLMTDQKIYLNENLSLRDMAQQLNVDANLLSFILNNHIERNFHDFVNYYRIEDVKSKLSDPRYSHLTVLGVGLESGFNSKTTFNRVFKLMTGMTPSDFQRKRQ